MRERQLIFVLQTHYRCLSGRGAHDSEWAPAHLPPSLRLIYISAFVIYFPVFRFIFLLHLVHPCPLVFPFGLCLYSSLLFTLPFLSLCFLIRSTFFFSFRPLLLTFPLPFYQLFYFFSSFTKPFLLPLLPLPLSSSFSFSSLSSLLSFSPPTRYSSHLPPHSIHPLPLFPFSLFLSTLSTTPSPPFSSLSSPLHFPLPRPLSISLSPTPIPSFFPRPLEDDRQMVAQGDTCLAFNTTCREQVQGGGGWRRGRRRT